MKCLSILVQKKQWHTSYSKTILLRLGIFFVFYLVYLSLGAVIFWLLESSCEKIEAINLYKVRQGILERNPSLEKDLDDFEHALKLANGITNYIIYNRTYESKWSICESVFFVCTLLTTIGYGHVIPQTIGGKVFTIIYATIGIPMTLILLSTFVERLLVIVMSFLLWLDTRLFLFYGPLMIRLIHLGIVLTIIITTFLFIPAVIISTIEVNWNLLDSFYYCFTSLTSIGLGDFIPGNSMNQPDKDLYRMFVILYLYAGSVAMMLTMAIIYDIPEIKVSSLLSNMPKDTERAEAMSKELEVVKLTRRASARSLMDRDTVMEKARLSRTTLGLGLRYGLDWGTASNTRSSPDKKSTTFLLNDGDGES